MYITTNPRAIYITSEGRVSPPKGLTYPNPDIQCDPLPSINSFARKGLLDPPRKAIDGGVVEWDALTLIQDQPV